MRAPTRLDILRGEYGRYRANNDLLHYDLDVRVDPEKKFISGKNTIRFKMLKDDTRIQLELFANYTIEKILMDAKTLKYERDHNTVYVDFPETLRAGRTYSIEFHYSGSPQEQGRFGALAFRTDPGRPALDQHRQRRRGVGVVVAQQGSVARRARRRRHPRRRSQRPDQRVERAIHGQDRSRRRLHALGLARALPDQLLQRLAEHRASTRSSPRTLGDLTMDYFVLPGNLEKAKVQFAQAKPMIEAFEKYVGKYPFPKDGFKLIEVPYSGMEHQSAVTYGNRYANGYLERDWTDVGVSLKFDFIIIHESGHEWFGNAVSAADVSDMWIQEGWCNYLEFIYVEALFGRDDAHQVRQRLQDEGRQQGADHHPARHPSHAEPGHVLQGRAVPPHAAQRRQRRCAVVEAGARAPTSSSSTRTS